VPSAGPADAEVAASSVADGLLCTAVRDLCDRIGPLLGPGPAADGIAAVRHRLGEPTMRIAVGGRLKAGKSTLVNALLGQRLAATDILECTLLVAWFRYGYQNRIEVRRRDGRVYHVPGEPGGGIPRDLSRLGAPPAEIAELVVEVANQRLAAEYTVVDTPGIDSLSGLDDVALDALARADALLYVTPLPGDVDMAALDELRRQSQAYGITAVNVLAVLSRIDLRGDGISDPWPTARRLAGRYATVLAGVAADVVPVAGLLAQTVTGDEFTDADTHLLRQLAAAPDGDLQMAIFSEDTFAAWADGPLSEPGRQRLLSLLGRYGIMAAVRAIREAGAAGISLSTVGLLGTLRAQCGIDELIGRLEGQFIGSADKLRASAAIAALERVRGNGQNAADAAALAEMRAGLKQIRRHWLLRQAGLLEALAELAAGRLQLPPKAEHALRTLVCGASPESCLELPDSAGAASIRQAADEQIRLWQELEWYPALNVRRWARRARELCEALYFEVPEPAP
jgi:Dynamin family